MKADKKTKILASRKNTERGFQSTAPANANAADVMLRVVPDLNAMQAYPSPASSTMTFSEPQIGHGKGKPSSTKENLDAYSFYHSRAF